MGAVGPVTVDGIPDTFHLDVQHLPKIQVGLDPVTLTVNPVDVGIRLEKIPDIRGHLPADFQRRPLAAGRRAGVRAAVRRGAGHHGAVPAEPVRGVRRASEPSPARRRPSGRRGAPGGSADGRQEASGPGQGRGAAARPRDAAATRGARSRCPATRDGVEVDVAGLAVESISVRPLGDPGAPERAWLRLALPALTRPGEYRGTIRLDGREEEVILDVEPRMRLRLSPRRLVLRGRAGERDGRDRPRRQPRQHRLRHSRGATRSACSTSRGPSGRSGGPSAVAATREGGCSSDSSRSWRRGTAVSPG